MAMTGRRGAKEYDLVPAARSNPQSQPRRLTPAKSERYVPMMETQNPLVAFDVVSGRGGGWASGAESTSEVVALVEKSRRREREKKVSALERRIRELERHLEAQERKQGKAGRAHAEERARQEEQYRVEFDTEALALQTRLQAVLEDNENLSIRNEEMRAAHDRTVAELAQERASHEEEARVQMQLEYNQELGQRLLRKEEELEDRIAALREEHGRSLEDVKREAERLKREHDFLHAQHDDHIRELEEAHEMEKEAYADRAQSKHQELLEMHLKERERMAEDELARLKLQLDSELRRVAAEEAERREAAAKDMHDRMIRMFTEVYRTSAVGKSHVRFIENAKQERQALDIDLRFEREERDLSVAENAAELSRLRAILDHLERQANAGVASPIDYSSAAAGSGEGAGLAVPGDGGTPFDSANEVIVMRRTDGLDVWGGALPVDHSTLESLRNTRLRGAPHLSTSLRHCQACEEGTHAESHPHLNRDWPSPENRPFAPRKLEAWPDGYDAANEWNWSPASRRRK